MNKNTLKYGVDVRRWEGVFVIGGTLYRVVGYMQNLGGGVIFLRDWELRKKHESGLGAWAKCEVLPFDKATVDATDSANCSLFEFIESGGDKVYPGEYLQTWCKWPNVENLARQGHGTYLNDIIDKVTAYQGYYYAREHFYVMNVKNHINVKAAKPHEMLGLDKSEMRVAKEYGLQITEEYRKMKEIRGVKIDRDALEYLRRFNSTATAFWLEKDNTGTGSWAEACRKIGTLPPVRTLHYLLKQRAGTNVYRDWLVALCDVMGVRDFRKIKTDDLYPKDIRDAHDKAVARRVLKENALLAAAFAARAEERAEMAWRDDETGLMIRAAASQRELIDEGQKLHHCVGGYAKPHAEGKTTIFFIRHIETPDEPFYTLEYKNGRVAQNRGQRNCDRTPEVVIFEKKWLEHRKALKTNRKGD